MKYWRGYLTGAILLACAWALNEFAKAHTVLVDMVYPYVSRMSMTFLAEWSAGVSFCMWQALLLMLLALVLTSGVLMVVFKWNPVRWGGWVCAVLAAAVFLNTCLYGLNRFSGPLSEDIRLEETDYTIAELESATVYYRDQANMLAGQVQRDGTGEVVFGSFQELAAQAVDGFEYLVYDQSLPVFAGPMVPVKELGWDGWFTSRGMTGVTVGFTGEAAVSARIPAVLQPFAMCREMARRASISIERDAAFAGYLACMSNGDVRFQYSGALMGYRYCLKALTALDAVTGSGAVARVTGGESAQVSYDLSVCDGFFGDRQTEDAKACDLLTSWHIQEIVLPSLAEEENLFDPMDKTQVDLSDHPDA